MKWKLNSLGFRGPELEPGKATVAVFEPRRRSVCMSEGQEYPRQLERALRERLGADAVQVANLAYPGISIGQALIRLEQQLDAVRPAMAVAYPSVAAYVELPANGQWHLGRAPTGRRIPTPRLVERLRELLKRSVPEAIQTAIRARQADQAADGDDVWQALPEENVEGFRRDLAAFLDAFERRGIPVALVTHATRFGDAVAPDERHLLIAWRKFYPQLAEDAFLDMERRLNAVIRDAARERGLTLIDAAAKMPPGPENFVEFVHFTDAGAGRLAAMIADGIEARWLTGSPRARPGGYLRAPRSRYLRRDVSRRGRRAGARCPRPRARSARPPDPEIPDFELPEPSRWAAPAILPTARSPPSDM